MATSTVTRPRLRQVAVADLALGMYVAELDRPWVGTPFMFQGFEITSSDDLKQLRATCNHVFIDTGDVEIVPEASAKASSLSLAPMAAPAAAKDTSDLGNRFEELCAAGATYNDSHSVEDEIPRARDVQNQVYAVVDSVFARLRAGGALDLDELSAAVNPMITSVLRNRDALSVLTLLRRKDDYTYNHSVATAVWALLLGRQLGLDRNTLQDLALGGILLDVGKTRIPNALLNTASPLTSEEFDLMRKHVDFGQDIVASTGASATVLEAIGCHHERHDGSGYPKGLSADAIPVVGRIIGLADSYDAMISQRPYAAAQSSFAVMKTLHKTADFLFQAELIEQFMQAVGMFPTGTVVELNTKEVGIVVAQNPVRRLRPSVLVVLAADRSRLDRPTIINLLREPNNKIWINNGLEAGAYGIDPETYYL